VLRETRLVRANRKGLNVHYHVSSNSVCAFWLALWALGSSRLACVDRLVRDYLCNRADLEPVDSGTLLSRLSDGNVVALDARPLEEYSGPHIADAVSIPLEQLEERLTELPPDKDIVAYCRDPYCVMSIEAVQILTKRSAGRMQAKQPTLVRIGYRSKERRLFALKCLFIPDDPPYGTERSYHGLRPARLSRPK
jgi:rhodanese-related sulfurtransferase